MVGVPRSRGCLLCVKRRVKCDEVRPACGNCIRYGAECPGYDRSFKFVAGKHHVRARRPRDLHETVLDLSSSPDEDTSGLPSSSLAIRKRESPSGSESEWDPPSLELYCPSEITSYYIVGMIDHLFMLRPQEEIMFIAPWFTTVPLQLGRKVHLDSAMCSFTMHLLGKVTGDKRLVGESRSLYGRSLVALQKALNHPTEWKSQETLCATMILCLFELFAGTKDAESWMKHAAGVSWLIQQRGPGVYTHPIDRAILLSFRPIIIMNALFSGVDCFLAQKKWEKELELLSEELERDPISNARFRSNMPKGSFRLVGRYLHYLAKIPSILRHGWALREAVTHDMPIDLASVYLLTRRTEKLHADYLAWYERILEDIDLPEEVPTQDPTSPFETVLAYPSPWTGALHIGWWASMLIIQNVLNGCHQNNEYTEKNHEYANNIFRSLENVSAGVMGPYRVGYALRISYEFADVPTQYWIHSLLARFQPLYAATSGDVFPRPGSTNQKFL